MFKVKLAVGVAVFALSLASAAQADETPVGSAPAGEMDLVDVLDQLYTSYTRVDDSVDQLWGLTQPDGEAFARARFAGYQQDFGYVDDGGTFVSLLTNSGSNPNEVYDPDSPVFTTFTPVGDSFQFALQSFNQDDELQGEWSSLQSENPGGQKDHMVTYLILDADDPNSIGNYVIAWEDLNLGDHDYNDFIIEVSGVKPMPEPGTLVLLGVGAVGLAVTARRRRAAGAK